jgi:hypothetical protein
MSLNSTAALMYASLVPRLPLSFSHLKKKIFTYVIFARVKKKLKKVRKGEGSLGTRLNVCSGWLG